MKNREESEKDKKFIKRKYSFIIIKKINKKFNNFIHFLCVCKAIHIIIFQTFSRIEQGRVQSLSYFLISL